MLIGYKIGENERYTSKNDSFVLKCLGIEFSIMTMDFQACPHEGEYDSVYRTTT